MNHNKLDFSKNLMGAWQTIPHSTVTEALLSTGKFQWLGIDFEHSGFDIDHIHTISLVADKHQVPVLIRLSEMDIHLACKLLDLGVHGFIVPMVESSDDLKHFSEGIHFPKRGACLSTMNSWGDHFETYTKEFKPIIIPQIESVNGVKNAKEIFSLDFVEAFFIGPYDLSSSLGTPGNFETPDFKELLAELNKSADSQKVKKGIHVIEPWGSEVQTKLEEGFSFIAFSTDALMLRKLAKKSL